SNSSRAAVLSASLIACLQSSLADTPPRTPTIRPTPSLPRKERTIWRKECARSNASNTALTVPYPPLGVLTFSAAFSELVPNNRPRHRIFPSPATLPVDKLRVLHRR